MRINPATGITTLDIGVDIMGDPIRDHLTGKTIMLGAQQLVSRLSAFPGEKDRREQYGSLARRIGGALSKQVTAAEDGAFKEPDPTFHVSSAELPFARDAIQNIVQSYSLYRSSISNYALEVIEQNADQISAFASIRGV